MTGNQIIEEVIRTLLGGSREEMNKLHTTVSSGATSLVMEYELGGIQAGAQICIDNEMYRVWSVNPGTKTVTVEPGILASTQAGHTAGALVYVNPRFPRFAILDAMNKELRALTSPSNGLYRITSHEFTASESITDYPLPSDVMDIYDVYEDTFGPSQDWWRVANWSWNASANVTDFEYGASIHIPRPCGGRTVRIVYKAGFNAITDPTQEVATSAQLPLEMQDILHLGVLLRLGPSREIKRNFTEAQGGDARRAEEVPNGAVTNSFAWVRNQRATRITEERTRLETKFPPRKPAYV